MVEEKVKQADNEIVEAKPDEGSNNGMEVEAKPVEEGEKEAEKKEEESIDIHSLRMKIYPVDNYKMVKKSRDSVKNSKTPAEKREELKTFIEKNHTARVRVYGVVICHEKGFPSILVRVINNGEMHRIELFGGKISSEQKDYVRGLKDKLKKQVDLPESEYEVGDLLGTFYKINYEDKFVCYFMQFVMSKLD